MASSPPSTEVEREAMCPICLECLTDPVTLDCRHNFCRSCITGYCEKRAKVRTVRCPLCKTRIQKGTLQPNWQLANIVEKIKLGKLTHGKENRCKKHNEQLQLFCKDDEELVCLICEHSPEHSQHSVLLLEEADQEYKDKIKLQQKSLEKDRGNLVDKKLAEELKCQERLAQLEEEKQKVSSVFQQLHTFLEEKECLRLSQLDELKKEIEERHEENATKLSKEISRLNKWIKKMERKCQQPAIEFLQNIGSTMKNYENKDAGHAAAVLSPGLEESLRTCYQKNTAIEKITEKYKEEAIKLMESCEAAVGTYSAPATGPGKKADCRPLGPPRHGTALRPSGLRVAFQGEQPRTNRVPTLPPERPVKGPTAQAGKPPTATPGLPLCYTCRQSGHLKWDCPFVDCLPADVWAATQAWQENEGPGAEVEDDYLELQGNEADTSWQRRVDSILTPDQEPQQANFWAWTKGDASPLFEGGLCGLLCHHSLSRHEAPRRHSAPACGHLAKTSGPGANSWPSWLPGATGSRGSEGRDPAQGGVEVESVGSQEGDEAREVEGCQGADEIEEQGKEVQGESGDGGERARQEARDSGRDVGEETWNTREDREGAEKDQGPSNGGQEGDKGTRGTEARASRRGRSGDGGVGKVSGCRKDEPGGEGSGKEVRGDPGQPGGRLQGQKENLGGSKEQGASRAGLRPKRWGQGPGLSLSGYTWSLGRGYKVIGYPSPARAPSSTLAGSRELSSLGGPPTRSRAPASPSRSPAK